MAQGVEKKGKPLREFSQLLRIQERLLGMLQEVLDELGAPTTLTLLKELRIRTGSTATESFSKVTNSVEGAIRELKVYESELQAELLDNPVEMNIEGVSNLPATLARFLAERSQNPQFSYTVHQDPVRGWIICWKEYTVEGMVRGYGQFYERPYAWLEE